VRPLWFSKPTRRTEDRGRKTEDESSSSSVIRHSSFVDLVVVRENTEGLYSGRERIEDDGATAIAERVITRRASERIVRAAFELARKRQLAVVSGSLSTFEKPRSTDHGLPARPRVTIVHKANVLRETCGLFRATALQVAAEYPDIAADELLVDNAALQLVQRPERFDVIVTTNMFGDILSDVASYWGGGLGLAVSANLGDRQALFEPVHGSAPDIAGQGIANPLAAIGCAALLLDYLADGRSQMTDGKLPRIAEATSSDEYRIWARRIRAAIAATLASGPKTPDLGGSATTDTVTKAVIESLKDI
jgi:homoisocitrate dehydrogenase